jgi:hypothetical protein
MFGLQLQKPTGVCVSYRLAGVLIFLKTVLHEHKKPE